jgi:hypothetical protein
MPAEPWDLGQQYRRWYTNCFGEMLDRHLKSSANDSDARPIKVEGFCLHPQSPVRRLPGYHSSRY